MSKSNKKRAFKTAARKGAGAVLPPTVAEYHMGNRG